LVHTEKSNALSKAAKGERPMMRPERCGDMPNKLLF
jgi:hypothetical protein